MIAPIPANRAATLLLALAVALFARIPMAVAQDHTYAIAPIAITGEPAPGTGGLAFMNFYDVGLSDSGIVVLHGSTDALIGTSSALWVGTPGNLALAIHTGDPAPGGETQSFDQILEAVVNGNGELLIHATYALSGQMAGEGLWVGPAGNLSLLARTGDPAPGTSGLLFDGFFFVGGSLDDSGTASTSGFASLAGSDIQQGAWIGTPGNLTLVGLSGDVVPGVPDNTFYGLLPPVLNNTGQSAVAGATINPDQSIAEGFWVVEPAGLTLVAHTGIPAPGTGGRNYSDFLLGESNGPVPEQPAATETVGPIVNQTGQVAFSAYVDSIDPLNTIGDQGIWTWDATGLTLVALASDLAPGAGGAAFLNFNHVNYNGQGQLAFDASLDVANPALDHGIWFGLPGSFQLLVREGDLAPGTAGETFGNVVLGPSMNNAGDIAFYARLKETGVDGAWGGTLGNLALILREGEFVRIKDGDYRLVQSIAYRDGATAAHATRKRFNEAGQLALEVTFTDGSTGIFLATPIAASPNQPPVSSAGPDLTIPDYQTVTIDGSASFDPEGTIISFSWSVDGVRAGSDPKLAVGPLPVGVHIVKLTVTDRNGASASDDVVLTVSPNQPPIANAGPDQTVTDLEMVTFDGSGSTDPEGDPLTYTWSLGGPIFGNGPNPMAGPFAAGTYTVTLTVTDRGGAIASDTMSLTVLNLPPVANAGSDRSIQTLETAALDGNASSDPEGGSLSYVWTLDGTQIATGPAPVVGPFNAGTHTITLTVTDDHGATASDDMVLTVLNRAPVAIAGPDRTANHAQTVALDGSASSDPEGGALSHAWTLNGVQIATGPAPVVGPFAVGTYTIALTVTDDHGATATDTMTLTVINEAPVANAGPDQTVGVKGRTTTVTLDGSASSDPEGGILSYLWTLDGQTVGTGAVAQVDVSPGTYTFTLTVTDDHGATASDMVIVTAVRGNV